MFERYRKIVMRSRLLGVRGIVQREGRVIHIVARHLEDLSGLLGDLDGHQEGQTKDFPTSRYNEPSISEKHPLLPSVADPASFPSRDFH